MVAVPVEPSWLGPPGRLGGGPSTEAEVLSHFIEIRKLAEDLRMHGLQMLLTRDLEQLLWGSVNMATSQEIGRLLSTTVQPIVKGVSVRVPATVEAQCQTLHLEWADGVTSEGSLVNYPYQLWQPVLACSILDWAPRVVLSRPAHTVFRKGQAIIGFQMSGQGTARAALIVHSQPATLACEQSVALHALAVRCCRAVERLDISSDGTHGSMWRRSIRRIEDIPPEYGGSLLRKWWSTGLLTEAHLLDLVGGCSPCAPPRIDFSFERRRGSCDVLDATLRARGRRTNAQRLAVYMTPPTGELLERAFGGRMTEETIDQLLTLADRLRS